jgi:hypothetical protein
VEEVTMSRTYRPRNKKAVVQAFRESINEDLTHTHLFDDGGYDMNVSGVIMMTAICDQAGFTTPPDPKASPAALALGLGGPCIPFKATAKQAREYAAKLRVLAEDSTQVKNLAAKYKDCFRGTTADVKWWILEFATFLDKSGGYKVD